MLMPFQLFVQLSAKGTGRRVRQPVWSATRKVFTKRRAVFAPTSFSDRVSAHTKDRAPAR